MASRAKKISEYAVGVLSAGNTYFLGNIAGVTKRIAALASNITFTPSGGIAATTVQAAVEELDSEKFDKSGGTITGDVGVAGSVTVSDPDGRTATLEPPQASNSNVATLRATTNHPIRIKSGGTGGSASPILFNTNNTDVASFDASGNLLAGIANGSHHILQKNSPSDYATTVTNTSSTSPLGLRVLMTGVSGGAGSAMIACSDDALRFVVYGNGNVQNVNNSYGAISDAKLKRDVTDTGPKLSKVLAMRIVNYFLIGDPTNTKLLGLIAQELREISPGLVEETPDYEDVVVEPARTDRIPRQRQKTEARTVTQWKVEVRDGVAVRSSVEVIEHVPLFLDLPLVGEDGQQIIDVVDGKQVPAVFRQPVMEDYTETVDVPAKIERRATGTVTLSIKYSILVPMLIKAMQELHADFDGRLMALEA